MLDLDGFLQEPKSTTGFKTSLVGDVVDDDGRLGPAVVHRCQRVVALLARGVPNFEFDRRVVQANCLGEKGGADGGFLVLVELTLDEPQHQRRFANRTFAQQNQLEGENSQNLKIGGGGEIFTI